MPDQRNAAMVRRVGCAPFFGCCAKRFELKHAGSHFKQKGLAFTSKPIKTVGLAVCVQPETKLRIHLENARIERGPALRQFGFSGVGEKA